MKDERTYKIIGAAMEVHRTDGRRQMIESEGQKAEGRGPRLNSLRLSSSKNLTGQAENGTQKAEDRNKTA